MVAGHDGQKRDASAGSNLRALVFELDNVAVAGRDLKFHALSSALKPHRVELRASAFTSYCQARSQREGLVGLLQAAGKPDALDALLESVRRAESAAFADAKLELRPECAALLKMARKLQVRLGALTALDAAAAESLMRQLGLAEMGIAVQSVPAAWRGFRAEHWVQLAQKIAVPPRRCVAVTTQATSCRAALATRMRCCAQTDRFTGHQDYSGADLIGDTIDVAAVGALLSDGKSA